MKKVLDNLKEAIGLTQHPLISLVHTTARTPDGWHRAYLKWLDTCDHPERVEYVVSYDEGDRIRQVSYIGEEFGSFKETVNKGRKCAVDGWNAAAAASTGKLIVTVSDDVFPPEHWDTLMLTALGDLDRSAVLEVDCGLMEKNSNLQTFSLLTRAYYDRYGYIFYPEYVGMFADNDFTETAWKDAVMVSARHIKFVHEHPSYGTAKQDSIYQRQHRTEAWETGKAVFRRRHPGQLRDLIKVMCPGETFDGRWVGNWTNLISRVGEEFAWEVIFAYSSNVHVARQVHVNLMHQQLAEMGSMTPDFVLWIDDDNLPSFENVKRLVEDLKDRPDLAAVAGWCFADQKTKPGSVSCGKFDTDGVSVHFVLDDLLVDQYGHERKDPLVPIDFTGFPFVLMRFGVFAQIEKNCFAPVLCEAHPYGFHSEDVSFCYRLKQAGLKLAVDRRVQVPHLRMQFEQPAGRAVTSDKSQPGQVVAA